MANGFISEEEIDDEIHVVRVEGDFDAALRDNGIAATEAALEAKPRALIVDVKRCTFIDSTAIAVVLGARQRAMDAGIGFALVGRNPTIDRMLELTGLEDELEILEDRNEAITALS